MTCKTTSVIFCNAVLFSYLFHLFLFIYVAIAAKNNLLDEQCRTCRFLVKTFLEGLDKTEKLHFGGGNTDWEEKKLGKFKTSETRFVEVMEHICGGHGSSKDNAFKCHTMAEKYEEILEDWFFNHQSEQSDETPQLEIFLCIKLEFCCNKDHFGPTCLPCPGLENSGKSCFGNGKCKGNGKRSGDGTCLCEKGYVGEMCNNCGANYFSMSQNSTYVECKACFDGCAGDCTSDGPKGCKECKSGYEMDENEGCKDIDECATQNEGKEVKCMKSNEECMNTIGSYECRCVSGYKRSAESGECEINVQADPPAYWFRSDQLLRLTAYTCLFLISLIVFSVQRHSFLIIALTLITGIAVIFIDFYLEWDGKEFVNFFRRQSGREQKF